MPLFVKPPGPATRAVSDAYARTLDVTPTIADVLGLPLGYRTDGRSAFGREARRRRTVRLATRDFCSVVRISGRRWEARRRAWSAGDCASSARATAGLYTGHRSAPRADRAAGAGLSRASARRRARARRGPSCSPRAARAGRRAGPDRRRPARRAARRAARPGRGGQRPDRGRRTVLPPARRPARALRVMVPEATLHDGATRWRCTRSPRRDPALLARS